MLPSTFIRTISVRGNLPRTCSYSKPAMNIRSRLHASEIGVGLIDGNDIEIEPLKRFDEDVSTLRARLIYQSRKRGIAESELLLSNFVDAHIYRMSTRLLLQYDEFLHENDWDIYYWVTQKSFDPKQINSDLVPNSMESKSNLSKPTHPNAKIDKFPEEWSNTVGKFKPAYRPVPTRWADSEILKLLRDHVISRSLSSSNRSKIPHPNPVGIAPMPDLRMQSPVLASVESEA